jgi:hypothetical protein
VHNVALAGADEATEMLQQQQQVLPPPAPLPMICPQCGSGFEDSEQFKAHLNAHGNNALAAGGGSPSTPPTTPSKKGKAATVGGKGSRSGGKGKKNFCEICSIQLSDRNTYISHNRANHPQRNKCAFCDYTSPRPYNVKAHTEQVHYGRKPHECDLCDFKASRRSALEQHIQNKHVGHPPPPIGWKREGDELDGQEQVPMKVAGKVNDSVENRVLVQPANGSSNLNSLQFMMDDCPATPEHSKGGGEEGGDGSGGVHGGGGGVNANANSGGNDSGISSSNHSSTTNAGAGGGGGGGGVNENPTTGIVVDNLAYHSQLGVMSDMSDVLNGYHGVHDDINMVSAEETVVSSNNNEQQQFILSDVPLEEEGGNGEQILATVDISGSGQQVFSSSSGFEQGQQFQTAAYDGGAAAAFNGSQQQQQQQQVLASLDVEGQLQQHPVAAAAGGVIKPKKQFHRNQPTEGELTCEECGYLANSRYAKKRHIKLVHDKRKDYTCTLCNQMFGQHGDAKRHAASKHKIPDGTTVKRVCFD